jgi:hypothetical protein
MADAVVLGRLESRTDPRPEGYVSSVKLRLRGHDDL